MVRKHSVSINGHSTSLSLEDPFWDEVKKAAQEQNKSVAALVARIDNERDPQTNLSSALRLYVLERLKARLPRSVVE
ncbi:MAG: ribbon-helix-helix domain-containing protein [Pseudomonadota bacterium]